MANTFSAYCREYINNQQMVLGMFNTYSLTSDLVKPLVSHRGKFVSYDQVILGSSDISDYNRDTGYAALNFTANRVEKELTQDKGNKLYIDLMDQEEAQIEGGTVRLFNQYLIKNVIPSVDAYRFGKMTDANNNIAFKNAGSTTSSTIVGKLLADKAIIENKRVKFDECVIYISTVEMAKLEEAAFGRGLLTIGAWGGNLDAKVRLFYGAKIVAVPEATIGAKWIIVHPMAFDAVVAYEEAQFFDKIPGFGGRRGEVDVGIYHDAWVQPNGEDGLLVDLGTVAKVGLPADFSDPTASGKIVVSNVYKGAKVYYGTSTGVTTASTELVAESDGVFRLPSVSATTTYYVIQAVDGVASAENSVKFTKA